MLSLAAHPCRRQQFGWVLDQRANVGRPSGTQKHRCPVICAHRSKLPSVLWLSLAKRPGAGAGAIPE